MDKLQLIRYSMLFVFAFGYLAIVFEHYIKVNKTASSMIMAVLTWAILFTVGSNFFLNEIIPVAEELDIKMAIHPDDPPIDIMGLPRIVKSESDLDDIVNYIDSPSNGITFCTGSLGANENNDLPKLIEKYKNRIHFLHLRNVKRESDGSFYEDNHLDGSSDMCEIVRIVLKIEKELDKQIPMRPDHGHQMLNDLSSGSNYAGYTAIGRLRGLAELSRAARA